MTMTSLHGALWASLMLMMQRVPHAWKRDNASQRRTVKAPLWAYRTGALWCDLPDGLSHCPGVSHCFRRWSARG